MMDHRNHIRYQVKQVLNGTLNPADITPPSDFFWVQYVLYKMHHLDLVKKMALIAKARLEEKGMIKTAIGWFDNQQQMDDMGVHNVYGVWKYDKLKYDRYCEVQKIKQSRQ